MRPRGEGFRRTEQEIAQEKATALGRAGERLEAALEEARLLAQRWAAARDPAERARLGEAYEVARQRARHARLGLIIQREAVGLRHHRIVEQEFPEPPRLPVTPRLG
jgi:hypothetical protein